MQPCRTCLIALFALSLAACSGTPSLIPTGSILPDLPSAGSLLPGFGQSSESKVERISANLYRLPSTTRTFESAEARENHELRRAAEATVAAGGTHFVLLPLGGARATGSDAGVMLRLIKVDGSEEAPVGMLSARDVLNRLGVPSPAQAAEGGLPANPAFPSEPAAPARQEPPPQLRGT